MKKFFDRLKDSIDKHDRIVLMTHSVPDLDGLGSAIAFSEIVKKMGKECFIVAPKKLINKTLNKAIVYLEDAGKIIPFKYEKAINGDLLVIFDTCEDNLVESLDILSIKDKFIIDHHSKCGELINGDVYHDDSKSSTAEIVCEFMNYLNIKIDSIYNTVLYAGMYQDSKGFILKTMPRTFLMASLLLENGANIKICHDLLREPMESVVGRYDYIKKCKKIYKNIYLCVLDDRECSSITVAKVADEMLKFEEVDASIAVGKSESCVLVSARSCDNIDVCSWMIKLGGGGHFGAAAAKVNDSLDEVINKINDIVRGS